MSGTDALLDRIEELEAKLANVTAERDRLDAAIKRQAGAAKTLRECTLSEVQHIKDNERKEYVATRSLDSERDANAILTDELEAAEAMLSRAYRAGVEAASNCIFHMTWEEDLYDILLLPTPTSAELLAMCVEKETE